MSAMVRFRIINVGVLSVNQFWGETERVHQVSATCTVLESEGKRLLVDPSPHPPALKQLLYDHAGLHPETIDQIFLTHWHGDHFFGIELFPNAECLMSAAGLAEWRQQRPQDSTISDRFRPAEGRLPAGIQLFPSPGHTLAHCALLAETSSGPLIVAGDAVMTPEYFEAEQGFSNAVDFALSSKTIRAIRAAANLVIPGHSNLIPNFHPA
jgi:glyoxylase-like metal-dependent hydrolase (beta-lactamase superfamily II)